MALQITGFRPEYIIKNNPIPVNDRNNSVFKNLKTDNITISKKNKEQLEYALSHEGRIRGE